MMKSQRRLRRQKGMRLWAIDVEENTPNAASRPVVNGGSKSKGLWLGYFENFGYSESVSYTERSGRRLWLEFALNSAFLAGEARQRCAYAAQLRLCNGMLYCLSNGAEQKCFR